MKKTGLGLTTVSLLLYTTGIYYATASSLGALLLNHTVTQVRLGASLSYKHVISVTQVKLTNLETKPFSCIRFNVSLSKVFCKSLTLGLPDRPSPTTTTPYIDFTTADIVHSG